MSKKQCKWQPRNKLTKERFLKEVTLHDRKNIRRESWRFEILFNISYNTPLDEEYEDQPTRQLDNYDEHLPFSWEINDEPFSNKFFCSAMDKYIYKGDLIYHLCE